MSIADQIRNLAKSTGSRRIGLRGDVFDRLYREYFSDSASTWSARFPRSLESFALPCEPQGVLVYRRPERRAL